MNYTDLNLSQRDALTAIVALEHRQEPPSAKNVHWFYEERFNPISHSGLTGYVLPGLVAASLAYKERSESDGRVWLYRPTDRGHEVVHQALRERLRWILPPEPTPDNEAQATLAEVLGA